MSTAHVTPSPELRAEVDRMLQRISFVQHLNHLGESARFLDILDALKNYSTAELAQDGELGAAFGWSVYQTHSWDRRRLLGFARQLRSAVSLRSDAQLLHRCRNLEAVLLCHLGDLPQAEQIWKEEALSCLDMGYKRGELYVWGNLAMVFTMQGHLEEALSCYQRALSLRDLANPFFVANTYNNMGIAYLLAGRLDEAEHAVATSLQQLAAGGTGESLRPTYLISFGLVLVAKGDQRAARAIAMRVAELDLTANSRAELNRLMGLICIREGDVDGAERHLAAALAEARALGERILVAEILEGQGELFETRGELDAAKERFLASEAVYMELPSTWHANRVRGKAEALAGPV